MSIIFLAHRSTEVLAVCYPDIASLVVAALDRGPGDTKRALFIAGILISGVIERLAEDILRVRR
jgi:hypothetical protein